jgi:hypothetical protein
MWSSPCQGAHIITAKNLASTNHLPFFINHSHRRNNEVLRHFHHYRSCRNHNLRPDNTAWLQPQPFHSPGAHLELHLHLFNPLLLRRRQLRQPRYLQQPFRSLRQQQQRLPRAIHVLLRLERASDQLL